MRALVVGLALVLGGCALEHEYLDYAAAEQVCIALVACVPGNDVGSPGPCITGRLDAEADEPGVYRCILAAGTNCDAVRACTGLTLVASPMCSAPTHCEGNAIVACGPRGFATRQECGAPSLPMPIHGTDTSVADDGVRAGICAMTGASVSCVIGACEFEGSRCTSSTHGQTCTGGLLTDDGDCAPGFECRAVPGEGITCMSIGETCTDGVCEGDVFRVCQLDASGVTGHLWRGLDCASIGMRCEPHHGCVFPEGSGDCNPLEAGPGILTADCRGDVFVYCGLDRHAHSYDCVAHGWASCSAREVGTADASPRVSCVPHGLVLDVP